MAESSSSVQTCIVIGAGISGINMGVQLRKQLGIDDFTIYDRCPRVGGVWTVNRYPNLSCDILVDAYSYSYFCSSRWKTNYGTREEILQYLETVIATFSLTESIKLGQECLSTTWSPEDRCWLAKFRDVGTNAIYERKARFLITGIGQTSAPKGIEDIPRLEKFKGDVVFTTAWRDIDFENKRVLCIGNGAAANQVIPWLMNDAKVTSLVHVFRQAQWMLPKADFPYSSTKKWIFQHIPLAFRIQRFLLCCLFEVPRIAMTRGFVGRFLRSAIEKMSTGHIKQAPEKYHHDLVPTYPIGGKRPIQDHGYIECTKRGNFDLVCGDGIADVLDDGHTIIDTNQNAHEVDIVVVANGYYTWKMDAPMQVIGDDHTKLQQYWSDVNGHRAYMGTAISPFPNFFMLGGPNAFVVGSQFFAAECNVQYIIRILKKVITFPKSVIRPKLEAEVSFDNDIQSAMKHSVMGGLDGVNNYMIDKRSGKNFMVWPKSLARYWWSRCISRVRWEDWDLEKE